MYDAIAANERRSWILTLGFATFVVLVGWAFGAVVGWGFGGFVVALVFAGVTSFLAWWKSDKIALAMSHARPADPTEHARLHNLVEGLCIAGGLPKPAVYVVEDDAPNAFATGRDPQHGAVAVTTGLLAKLNRVELEGVLAHELSHIRNRDTLVATLAVTMVGVAVLLSEFSFRFLWWGGPRHRNDRSGGSGGPGAIMVVLGVVLLALAPIAAQGMRYAISRRRELLADVSAVQLTRYPPGLIAALEKLRDDTTIVHSGSAATAHLWIESPVARVDDEGRMAWLGRMFDTHPPLEERIEALREL